MVELRSSRCSHWHEKGMMSQTESSVYTVSLTNGIITIVCFLWLIYFLSPEYCRFGAFQILIIGVLLEIYIWMKKTGQTGRKDVQ
jgi:hypothetical protein